jgi:hypothetical protein
MGDWLVGQFTIFSFQGQNWMVIAFAIIASAIVFAWALKSIEANYPGQSLPATRARGFVPRSLFWGAWACPNNQKRFATLRNNSRSRPSLSAIFMLEPWSWG